MGVCVWIYVFSDNSISRRYVFQFVGQALNPTGKWLTLPIILLQLLYHCHMLTGLSLLFHWVKTADCYLLCSLHTSFQPYQNSRQGWCFQVRLTFPCLWLTFISSSAFTAKFWRVTKSIVNNLQYHFSPVMFGVSVTLLLTNTK